MRHSPFSEKLIAWLEVALSIVLAAFLLAWPLWSILGLVPSLLVACALFGAALLVLHSSPRERSLMSMLWRRQGTPMRGLVSAPYSTPRKAASSAEASPPPKGGGSAV